MKFKVGFNFKDSIVVEAKDEDTAIEKFMLSYENKLQDNNETMENRVWETVKAKQI